MLEELQNYALNSGEKIKDIKKYIEEGKWKGRAGGRYLINGGNRVYQQEKDNIVEYILLYPSENWMEWIKTLGKITIIEKGKGYIERNNFIIPFKIKEFEKGIIVEVANLINKDRHLISAFNAIAIKSSYCCHCKTCEVECPTGALKIDGNVYIDNNCSFCGFCLNVNGIACLNAKSISISEGGEKVRNNKRDTLQSYQTFGLRKIWLLEFFKLTDRWLIDNSLGNRQIEAMKLWLKHSELIEIDKKRIIIPEIVDKLKRIGLDNKFTWAIIWTNLARNSKIINWYLKQIPWGSILSKDELIIELGKNYHQSERSRENAIDALSDLFKNSPLGNELELGIYSKIKNKNVIYKKGWEDPDPIAILYSLYRYAENTGRYQLTLNELYENAVEGPFVLFGINRELLEGILKGLSIKYNDFIRVNIVKDLDNIFLDNNRKSIEVIDLV
ncbi:hypothetical protein [Thermovenabulum sp.]|uniref:hypothetical protein n=1 Tax=Thermovenabulum sp. TaxID=3100335 RepID=UPI003C7D6397